MGRGGHEGMCKREREGCTVTQSPETFHKKLEGEGGEISFEVKSHPTCNRLMLLFLFCILQFLGN